MRFRFPARWNAKNIGKSGTFRGFLTEIYPRILPRSPFLDKCFQAIRPATWKELNAALAQAAVKSGAIDVSTIRADTTAVETNIHWPTDASLLWDTWRVAARLLREGRAIAPETCPHRFHDRKTKRLYLFITRYSKSKNARRQRKVRAAFRQLITRAE